MPDDVCDLVQIDLARVRKIRGALNALLSLSPAVRARGVVASSAGNHGIGIAMAAGSLKVPVTVFVPSTAPAVKREKIAALGARVESPRRTAGIGDRRTIRARRIGVRAVPITRPLPYVA